MGNAEGNPLTLAQDLAADVMTGGYDWSVDGPKIVRCAELLYGHLRTMFSPLFWGHLQLSAIQTACRAIILLWAEQYQWDAPVLDDKQEDVIWGWMVDMVVQKEHTGSYR